MKRCLSLLLAFCMAVSFSVSAAALGDLVDMDVSAVLSAVTNVVAAEEADEPAETAVPVESEDLPAEEDIPATTEEMELHLEETAPILMSSMTDTSMEGLENIRWTFEDGVLIFSGVGPIPDVSDTAPSRAPWHEYEKQTVSIVVEEGITGIGGNAFSFFRNVVDVVLPNGVEYIGRVAFEGCSKLESINLPEGLISIGECAFMYCTSLESVHLPSTIEEIGRSAFYGGLDHVVSTAIADREGYEFLCWYDDDGNTYATTNEGRDNIIYPMWLRSFSGFEDVFEDDWYYDYVKYCYQFGLMSGMGDGTFAPGGNATRGQVVTVLYRLAGEPEVTGGMAFSDVYESDWYYDAVSWAASEGIAQGMGDDIFAPNENVTREQFLVFLYRFIDAMGDILNDWDERYYLTEDTVSDVSDISDWAMEAELWSVIMGLQVGYDNEDGTFSLQPGNSITRGELAAFLTRYSLDAYYYYCAEIAEALSGYGADSVTDEFGQPNEKTDVNSQTQNWYYYEKCLGMEFLWDEEYSMWYLNRWWFEY